MMGSCSVLREPVTGATARAFQALSRRFMVFKGGCGDIFLNFKSEGNNLKVNMGV